MFQPPVLLFVASLFDEMLCKIIYNVDLIVMIYFIAFSEQ